MAAVAQPESLLRLPEVEIFALKQRYITAQSTLEEAKRYLATIDQILLPTDHPQKDVGKIDPLLSTKFVEEVTSVINNQGLDQKTYKENRDIQIFVRHQVFKRTLSQIQLSLTAEEEYQRAAMENFERKYPQALPLSDIQISNLPDMTPGEKPDQKIFAIAKTYAQRKNLSTRDVLTQIYQRKALLKNKQLPALSSEQVIYYAAIQRLTEIPEEIERNKARRDRAKELNPIFAAKLPQEAPTPSRRSAPVPAQPESRTSPETPIKTFAREIITQGFGQISLGGFFGFADVPEYQHKASFQQGECYQADTANGKVFSGRTFTFAPGFGTIYDVHQDQITQFAQSMFGSERITTVVRLHLNPGDQTLVIQRNFQFPHALPDGKNWTRYTFYMPAKLYENTQVQDKFQGKEPKTFIELSFIIPSSLGEELEDTLQTNQGFLDSTVNVLFPGLVDAERRLRQEIVKKDRQGRYSAYRLNVIDQTDISDTIGEIDKRTQVIGFNHPLDSYLPTPTAPQDTWTL